MSLVVPDISLIRDRCMLEGRQPQHPVEIDWSHPLAHGLRVFILPELLYRANRDVVGALDFDGSNLAFVQLGTVANARTLRNPYSNSLFWGWNVSTPELTHGFSVSFSTVKSNANEYALWSDNAGAQVFRIGVRQGGIAVSLAQSAWINTLRGSAQDSSVPLGARFSASASWKAGTNQIEVVVDGKQQAVTYTYTGAPAFVPSLATTLLGNGTSWTYVDHDIDHLALWDRKLSVAEMAAFQRDPYQILRLHG